MDIFNRIDVFNQYKDVVMEGVNVDSANESANESVNDSNNPLEEISIEEQSNESSESNESNEVIDTIDMNTSGGLIYDLLHILDDMYVYSRTFIENNYFNLSENDDFNLVYPNIYVGNYSTSTNYKLL